MPDPRGGNSQPWNITFTTSCSTSEWPLLRPSTNARRRPKRIYKPFQPSPVAGIANCRMNEGIFRLARAVRQVSSSGANRILSHSVLRFEQTRPRVFSRSCRIRARSSRGTNAPDLTTGCANSAAGTTLLGSTPERGVGPRASLAVLMLILLGVGLCSALHAVAKPFWYDEIITTIVCHLPTVPAIWHALDSAADTNPPFFYVVFRLAGRLISDDHLGYRLPSILGLLGTVLCIYIALARRLSRLSALVAATSVLCTPLASYAFEARPYAHMLGCISGAVVAWQRIDDSMLWALVVAIALAMAESLHYYAILVWPAFVVAELSVCIVRRR